MCLPGATLIVLVLFCRLSPALGSSPNEPTFTEPMQRACSQFIRGVHANQDPLDPQKGRGSPLFSFTYTQGHAHADQIRSTPPVDGQAFGKPFEAWPIPNRDRISDPTILSVEALQAYENATFNVDSLHTLDRSLAPPLGLSELASVYKLTYGFTYSNEYKFERDQIDKAGMSLIKYKVQYNTFHLSLNLSAIKLSPGLTSDLQSANKDRAAALVAKYGALFISSATFGVSYTQTDYIPKSTYFWLHDNVKDGTMARFGETLASFYQQGNQTAGRQLMAALRSLKLGPYHRRTSLSRRGGLFSPPNLAKLPDWSQTVSQRPDMLGDIALAPLSELIPHSKPDLKREVARLVRTQLVLSIALNLLELGLFEQSALHDANVYFPGFMEYATQTRQQMARMVAKNDSALGDPSVSPFPKLVPIARALDFMATLDLNLYIGLNSTQVEQTYRSIVACNKYNGGPFTSTLKAGPFNQLKPIHAALKKVALKGESLFNRSFFSAFTSWSEGNQHLKSFDAHYKEKLQEMAPEFKAVNDFFRDYSRIPCGTLGSFLGPCSPGIYSDHFYAWQPCPGREG